MPLKTNHLKKNVINLKEKYFFFKVMIVNANPLPSHNIRQIVTTSSTSDTIS